MNCRSPQFSPEENLDLHRHLPIPEHAQRPGRITREINDRAFTSILSVWPTVHDYHIDRTPIFQIRNPDDRAERIFKMRSYGFSVVEPRTAGGSITLKVPRVVRRISELSIQNLLLLRFGFG